METEKIPIDNLPIYKYIIINLSTKCALYGLEYKTLTFNTYDSAENLANQLCNSYMIVKISI